MKLIITLFLLLTFASGQDKYNKNKPLFQGVWKGYATQGNGTSWSLEVTLVDGINQIAYPSLGCGGDLVLLNQTSISMTFREKLKYGRKACVDQGKVVLQLFTNSTDRRIQYDWYYKNGKHDAHTTIIKQ